MLAISADGGSLWPAPGLPAEWNWNDCPSAAPGRDGGGGGAGCAAGDDTPGELNDGAALKDCPGLVIGCILGGIDGTEGGLGCICDPCPYNNEFSGGAMPSIDCGVIGDLTIFGDIGPVIELREGGLMLLPDIGGGGPIILGGCG
mmetsp:Transcript_12146/g.37021  ORF Transcript_12146/g.37021 Transcript_12146/m.37021 type:complete len:145 (+) Transcript_12146:3134-3568(+)